MKISNPKPQPSPKYRRLIKSISHGEVIVPLIREALTDASFSPLMVKLYPPKERKPDGWFHPSTHPMWPERLLWYYLKQPQDLIPEPREPHSTIALMQGTFWHEFIGHVGMEAGIFLDKEVHVRDENTRARGNFDWLLREEIGELKTMKSSKLRLFPEGDPDDEEVVDNFMERFPVYYAQAMEYLRLSGYERWRCVIVALEYPFPMREIALTYDHRFGANIRDKYLRVLDAYAGEAPFFCCGGGKTAQQCGARAICPMGTALA